MVRLVPVPQPPQDGERVVDGRLGDQDGLEPASQRGIPLDVLPVLAERGCADDVQLAAGEGRFDHIGSVHAALGASAGADDRVQLVNEDDELVTVLADLVDDPAQALLEVTAVASASDHARQLELNDPLARQRLRDFLVHDALRDSLDDGGLAHSGLADQHRIVLASPG